MRKLIVIAAILMASPALAEQCIDPSYDWPSCPPSLRPPVSSVTGNSSVTSSWTPTCPDGYALLVYPATGGAVCARNLQPPR
jgi:hypothetical protein